MKIIVCGKSGSGKDYLRKNLQSKGLLYASPYTTRPKRTGELDGVDYYFTEEESYLKNRNTIFIEGNFFGWFYGIGKEQWSYYDLFILPPSMIEKIPVEQRKICFIIYLDIDREIRKERLLSRNGVKGDKTEEGDSIERRLNSDDEDFKNFTNYDIKITNPNF